MRTTGSEAVGAATDCGAWGAAGAAWDLPAIAAKNARCASSLAPSCGWGRGGVCGNGFERIVVTGQAPIMVNEGCAQTGGSSSTRG